MNARQLGRHIAGATLVFLSLCSIVLSLGAPGLGWVVSGGTLIVASISSPLIGWRWLMVCTGLTCLLLLTFGPLGIYDSSPFNPDWVMATFTFGPLAIGLAALILTFLKPRLGKAGA